MNDECGRVTKALAQIGRRRSHRRAANIGKRLIHACLATLTSLPIDAATFDVVNDFSTTINSDTSPWSYRYKPGTVRDGNYSFLPGYGPAAAPFATINPGAWTLGGEVPEVGVNQTGSDAPYTTGVVWPKDTMLVHPGNIDLVIVSWLSPSAAIVNINFSFADLDPNGGNGLAWFVEKNNSGTTLSAGSFPNGGASGPLTLSGIPVSRGDRINFIVDPNGDYGFDSTMMRAAITQVPTEGIPVIITSPQSRTNNAGTTAAFSVFAGGSQPLSYQWRKEGGNLVDGGNVSGTASASLTLSNVLGGDAGGYSIVITNSSGSVTSAVSQLTVVPLMIASQPQSQSLLVGDDGTFTVLASGPPPFSYEWRFNGTPISGATNATLVVTNVQLSDSGDYAVLVARTSASVTSAVARLTVRVPGALDVWSVEQRPPSASLYGVTYGNGVFVAVGDNGIFTSTSAVGWTKRLVQTNTSLRGVVYGNGEFVAVGQQLSAMSTDAIIFTSPDGISWSQQTVMRSNSVNAVAFGNGVFVAVGGNGAIFTSIDGLSWSNDAIGQGSFAAVTYGQGGFIALTSGGMGAASAGGVNWILQNSGPSGGITTGVTYGNGSFVATSYIPGHTDYFGDPPHHVHFPAYVQILSSQDGIDWPAGSTFSYDNLSAVTYAHGTFVAVGHDDKPGRGIILTSTDGTNWFDRPSGISPALYAVAYGNGRFVAVGAAGATVMSRDGANWGAPNLHSVTSGGGILVAAGLGGEILTSSDGSNWVEQTSGTFSDLDEVIFADNRFVAVGNDGIVLSSANGTNWAVAASGNMNELHGITYDNGTFIAVGRAGTVLTSSDAISWTSRASGTSNYLKAVTYGGGLFVAVGNLSSNVLTSTDGIVWTNRNLPRIPFFSPNLEDVIYAGGTFVAVGDSGYVAISPDGITWTESLTPTYENLRAVTYANGVFVIVANYGTVLTSDDGVTWTLRPTLSGRNLRDIAYFNGSFVAVGNDGTILQSGSFAPARLTVRGRPNNEGFEFVITGEMGRSYRIQASTDTKTWIDVFSFDNSEQTTLFLDSDAANLSHRIYRVVSP